MDNYLNPPSNRKKIHIDDDDLTVPYDNTKKIYKKRISHSESKEINEIDEYKKKPIVRQHTIYDSYNLPEKLPKTFKRNKINETEFNKYFFGFEDMPNKIRKGKISNAYLFGEPSRDEIKISNWQKEQGVSNLLDQKIKQAETGEDIEDIKNAEQKIDNSFDVGYKEFLKNYENRMEELNKEKNIIIKSIENEQDPIKKKHLKDDLNDILQSKRTDEINTKRTINDHIKEKIKKKQI